MQVLYAGYFGRQFPYPTGILIDRRINLHKVYLIQMHRIPIGIYRPFKLELRHFFAVGVIVGIPPIVGIAYPNAVLFYRIGARPEFDKRLRLF